MENKSQHNVIVRCFDYDTIGYFYRGILHVMTLNQKALYLHL
jgi:hypothetical protein